MTLFFPTFFHYASKKRDDKNFSALGTQKSEKIALREGQSRSNWTVLLLILIGLGS